MKKAKITCITCIYNEKPNKLKITFESIINQSFKDFEYILVLDDPHNYKAEKLILEYKKKYKNIIFIKNKKNLGYGLSKNPGIKLAKGEYICICDSEHYYYKNKLELQYNYLEKNKNIDLLFTSYFGSDKNENKTKILFKENSNFKNQFFIESCFCFPTLMIKSKILKENLYEKQVIPDDFYLYIKLYKKNKIFKVIKNITMDVNFTIPNVLDPIWYLDRNFRASFNYLRIFLSNYFLFYNCKNFHRNMLNHFFMLCIFIFFKFCNFIGIFKPIIWEKWLVKKWK